jgi:hypothetical protein
MQERNAERQRIELSSVETTGIDQFIVMFQVLFEKETELILPLNLKESGSIDVIELTW